MHSDIGRSQITLLKCATLHGPCLLEKCQIFPIQDRDDHRKLSMTRQCRLISHSLFQTAIYLVVLVPTQNIKEGFHRFQE